MRRRIILAVVTLAVVGGIFAVYQLFIAPRQDAQPDDAGAAFSQPAGQDLTNAQEHRKLVYEDRDRKTGRLVGLYTATSWSKSSYDDSTYLAVEPRVQIFQRDGQVLEVSSREGTFRTDQIGRQDIQFRGGRLTGDVRVVYDRGTDLDRPPLEQRSYDRVGVATRELEFDTTEMVVFTSDPVQVTSDEADISGQGLTMRWNQSPDELRSLRIDHGQEMTVYYIGENAPILGLPGRPEAAPAPTGAPAAAGIQPAGPADATAHAVPTPAPGVAPATRPAMPAAREVAMVELPRPQSQPAPVAKAANQDAPRPASRNVYEAVFSENVVANQGASTLTGADTLTLRFEYERPKQRPSEQPSSAPAPIEGPAGAQVTPGASVVAAARIATPVPTATPGGGPVEEIEVVPIQAATRQASSDSQPAGAATATAASQPARGSRRGQGKPLVITWTGPLVLTPIGYADKANRGRYQVAGEGPKVVLQDGDTQAVCRRFSLVSLGDAAKTQQGRLMGADDQPVVLRGARGERVRCRELIYDPSPRSGLAVLSGPGWMELAGNAPPGGTAGAPDRIDWTGKLTAQFEPRQAARRTPLVRRAVFTDGVTLLQGASGDQLACDRLEARIGAAGDSSYVTYALAWGHARTTMAVKPADPAGPPERADVSAGAMEAWFDPPQPGQTDRRKAARRIEGTGGVQVAGSQDGQPYTVTADSMTASGQTDQVSFLGSPAKVVRGEQTLEAPRIALDDAAGTAQAVGAGTICFATTRDLSGQELKTPRPVNVAWGQSMLYRGDAGTAAFDGGVNLTSGQETMTCDRMTAHLQRQGGAGQTDRRSLAMGAGAVDMGNLDKVEANGQVKLLSQSRDGQGHLTGRLEVNGSRLVYDARTKVAEIPVAGTAVVEDYRPPDANAAAPPTGQAAPAGGPLGAAGQPSVDRPSVTAFTWDQSMALSQVDRTVNMAGDVKMRHRGSRRVLDVLNPQELARLNVPAWPAQMPPGRDTSLRCEHLLAQFGQPPADQASDTARFAGPLEMFEATTAVLMEDGDYRVEAQRAIYDSRSDVVSIHGYLEGQGRADARVVVRQPPSVTQSPDITWMRRTNTIYTGAVRGTGSSMGTRK